MARTSDQLRDAAVRIFAAKGYSAASVQEVADAVGIRKPSVYKHFASKEQLLLAALELGHHHREAVITEIDSLDAEPIERLREYLRRYVVRSLENAELTAVFSREWSTLSDPNRAADLRRRRTHRHFLRDLVVACQEAGAADPGLDARYAATYLRGAVNAAPEWYHPDGPDPVEVVARASADLGVTLVRAGRPVPPTPDPSPTQARSARLHEHRSRRDDIDAAALRIFCAKGFAAATVQDVAAEVGVLKGSIYHYVDSKDALLAGIFETAHLELTTIVGTVAQLDGSPEEQFLELIRQQVHWYLESPEQSTVLFREWPFLTGAHREIVVGRRKGLERFLRRLLEQAAATGEIGRDLDIHRALRFVVGAVNAVPTWYRPGGPDSPGRIAEVYAELTRAVLTGARGGSG
jgi:AcrR family transcriptional regulator